MAARIGFMDLVSGPAILTPGGYLRKRRLAAGLTIDDVAQRIATAPHRLRLADRADWLMRIEDDVSPIGTDVAASLHGIFPFSPLVLVALVALRDGNALQVEAPRLCRICACSERDACIDADGHVCAWDGPDLCTACAEVDFAREHGA